MPAQPKKRTLPISSVIFGERRRDALGDLDGLAESIERYGLLHPIVVDDANNLIAGGRRLLACVKLGLEEIEVRSFGDLSAIERREIELEENLRRKDLTPAERSKLMTEQAEAAEEMVKEERAREANGKKEEVQFLCKQCGEFFELEVWHCPGCGHHWSMEDKACKNCHKHTRPQWPNRDNTSERISGPARAKNTRGRPKAETDERSVADKTEFSRTAIQRAKKHRTAFERYPFLERPHWNQSAAIEAFKHLESLPEPDRPRAAAVVDQPAIPPDDALTILGTLVEMKPKSRAALFDDFESGDRKRQSDALCCAARKPPMPDPRIGLNDAILSRIERAEKHGEAAEYRTARRAIEALQARLRKEYEDEAKALGRRRNGR